jgi:hypothetical protein
MIILERISALSEFRLGGPMESIKFANGSVAPEKLSNTALGNTGQRSKVRASKAETTKETQAYILAVKTYIQVCMHTYICGHTHTTPPPNRGRWIARAGVSRHRVVNDLPNGRQHHTAHKRFAFV